MRTILRLIFAVYVLSVTNYTSAQTSQSFFEPFTDTSREAVWMPGNNSTRTIRDGYYICEMADQGSAYRGDIKYNNVNNSSISEEYSFMLEPSKDVYLAVKFIGKRPQNSATYNKGFKLEMTYIDEAGAEKWLNTRWNNGEDGYVVTDDGEYIYYFDLTKDETYTSMSNVKILFFNLVIADVDTQPYEYTIDWIGTFTLINDFIEISKGLFESFSSPEILNTIWFTANNSNSYISDGHLICQMGNQGTSYRGDIKYNNSGNNVAISSGNYFSLIPEENNYLVIKFIGKRPHGALKLEMHTVDGTWFNNQNSSAWNSGNPTFTSTDANNYIYYFDLMAHDAYKEYPAPIIIDFFNIIIADAKEAPYNYVIDWIGVFESLEAIEEFKNFKDDGENDKDEEITGVIIDGEVINITTLVAGQLIEATQLTLSGDWLEEHFELLEATLGNNEIITSIDMSLVSISNNDFLSGIKNPNCLKFVAEAASYPENWTNVVVGNNSENISLTDGYPYYSPKEFVTSAIDYTREYTTEGWASLCLPFDIEVSELPVGVSVYEFVKAEGTAITFNEVEEGVLTANTPYIADISDIGNAKVFAVNQAGDITVPSTNIIELTKGDYVFKGSFEEIRPAQGLYLLGSDGLGFGVGTSSSYVPPFRSYLESVDNISDAKYLTLGIGDGETTLIRSSVKEGELTILCSPGEFVIIADRTQTIEIYSIDGRLVKKTQLNAGENRIDGLSGGIYLLNNQKVVLN